MIIFTQGNDSKWDKVLPKSGIRNILDRWQDPSGGLSTPEWLEWNLVVQYEKIHLQKTL